MKFRILIAMALWATALSAFTPVAYARGPEDGMGRRPIPGPGQGWANLCQGIYTGQFHNGRPAKVHINNHGNGRISVFLEVWSPYQTQMNSGRCREHGNRADFNFSAPHPTVGKISHVGSIQSHGGRRAVMRGYQPEFNLGFTFQK